MALPDTFRVSQGTPISWKSTGGNYVITLASLAANAARQGPKADLGATWARRWDVLFSSAVGVAAAAGAEIELWWGKSTSPVAGTDNPSSLTGLDAALANPDEVKYQSIFIGSLILSAARGTAVQIQSLVFFPPTQYGIPFVVNKSAVALSATAANHEIRLTPAEDTVQD